MNVKRQVQYWLKSADSDLETAQIIFDSGKSLHYCLFFCHLVMEKGLKGLVAKRTESIPPRIHDLEVLAEKADIDLSEEMKEFFSLMNTYNLEAGIRMRYLRYTEGQQRDIPKVCSKRQKRLYNG